MGSLNDYGKTPLGSPHGLSTDQLFNFSLPSMPILDTGSRTQVTLLRSPNGGLFFDEQLQDFFRLMTQRYGNGFVPKKALQIPTHCELLFFYETGTYEDKAIDLNASCFEPKHYGGFSVLMVDRNGDWHPEYVEQFLGRYPSLRLLDAKMYGSYAYLHLIFEMNVSDWKRFVSGEPGACGSDSDVFEVDHLRPPERTRVEEIRWQSEAGLYYDIPLNLFASKLTANAGYAPLKLLAAPLRNFVYFFYQAPNHPINTLASALTDEPATSLSLVRWENVGGISTDSFFRNELSEKGDRILSEAIIPPSMAYAFLFMEKDPSLNSTAAPSEKEYKVASIPFEIEGGLFTHAEVADFILSDSSIRIISGFVAERSNRVTLIYSVDKVI